METTNFINSLKSSDFESFILVLNAYFSQYETRDLEIEYSGFNNNSGYVYLALENGITIASCFGQSVDYIVTNYRNDEEQIFDTYKEALNFLKYGEENDEENEEV
jgi:hypothetical protein